MTMPRKPGTCVQCRNPRRWLNDAGVCGACRDEAYREAQRRAREEAQAQTDLGPGCRAREGDDPR